MKDSKKERMKKRERKKERKGGQEEAEGMQNRGIKKR